MTDFLKGTAPASSSSKRRKKKTPASPLAGTQGRGGVTPLEVQREVSLLAGTQGQQVPASTPGAVIAPQPIKQIPPPLQHGVEGYVPEQGTVAKLDPDVEAAIIANIQGPIDATLANLTKAHYEVFGSFPSWSLTADLLDSGEVEFPTYEEALRFFTSIKRSYAASGKEWQLDAQGTNAGLLGQRERQKGLSGFGEDSDVLDPEMLASWNPKSVDDFLLGPYMKKTDKNRVTSMYRQGRLRLDEMLIELPKQWAISNLSNRLSARSRRFNPDRDEDESMMQELNEFLAARVPGEVAPAPTAAWQTKTEEGLRYLQMMRASALYMASGGENDDAAGFLHTQGYSDILNTLEEQIRLPADQTGRTDEARRAWVQDWFVRSRNPGITERMAVHQLADLNVDMVTIEGQRMIGNDHLMGYAGAVKGFVGGIPGAEQVGDVLTSDAFQKVIGPAVSFAGDIVDIVKPAVMVPVTLFAEGYEIYDKYTDAFQSAIRNSEDSVLATMFKPLGLPFGFIGLQPGMPEQMRNLAGVDPSYSNLWSEFFARVFKDEDDDGIELMGDFFEKFKDNLARREQGLPADYATEVLSDMGVNPLTHPEVAFLATFALDTVRDFGIAKVAGIGATAIRGTERFAKASDLARTTLHQESVGEMVISKFKEAVGKRTFTAEEVGPASPVVGKTLTSVDKNGFVSSVSDLFGWRGDQVADMGRMLRKAHARGATDDELLDIVRDAIGTRKQAGKAIARSGRKDYLRADSWGLSYRMREKALLDPSSVIYRGKHPVVAGWFERLWSSSVVAVNDDRLPDAVRQLGFSYRNSLRAEDIPWAANMDRAMLHELGDMESITELEHVVASGDVVRYAGFIEGLYADTRHLAARSLQLEGKALTKENIEAATVKLRERIALTFGRKASRRLLLEQAGSHFSKTIWHKDPQLARHWNALARAVDPDKPGDFVPLGLEHHMWNKAKEFDRGASKGEIRSPEHGIGVSGITAGKLMAPKQGDPWVKVQMTPDGPLVKVPNEQSVAFLYDEVEPQIQAYRDILGLDPDSGMPPGIIDEMAKLEGKSAERMELELKAVDTAHRAALDKAITRHEAGIVKAMREKKTLDEQLELFNSLLTNRETRLRELEELRAAGASDKKIGKAARKADKAESEVAAARIEVVRSKLPAYKELRDKTEAKSAEVREIAAERQQIKERLNRIQNRITAGLRLESNEPQQMVERVLLAEGEQRSRQAYLDAIAEEQHYASVMEFADAVGFNAANPELYAQSMDAWRMAQTVSRERQAMWRMANERVTQSRIVQAQGRYTGEGRPRVQLRFYEPDERAGTTPLDTAFNVDLPDSDIAALEPPPWIQEQYLMVLRRYGDIPAMRVLQEWLSEQLYGYTKKVVDEDPRVIYSREQIAEMTQQLGEGGYPLPARAQGPQSTPRRVKVQPSRSVTPEQLIEETLAEREKVAAWTERAKQAWLDAYEEHRLIYRDAPEQTTMRGIREAENILMKRKNRPAELRQPVRTIGTSMRTTDKGTPHPVTYVMPKQRGMRDSVRRTEIYFDSFRQLDQRLKALDARIAGLQRRTAPYYEPSREVVPGTPLVAGTGVEAERIAIEQAGPIMERTSTGRRVSSKLGKQSAEAGYEGVSEEMIEELSSGRVDVRTTHIAAREGEVEIPPNQHLHDTLARLASVGYLRGQVTLRVPVLKMQRNAPGTSPPSIVDAERWLTESKLGARGGGEPMPLTTAKGGMGWHRIPEYETFTETTGKGKRARTRTYTRVKRDPVTGEIVWKLDKQGRPMVAKGPTGGNRRMERLPDGRLVPEEPPLETGAQGPRFERSEMYGQLTTRHTGFEASTDQMVKFGGRFLADESEHIIYAPGFTSGEQIDLYNALRANGLLDEGWTITNQAPPEGLPKGALTALHHTTAGADRKFYRTYAELLGQALDEMFADGRNAPVVANLSADLAERAALRRQMLGEIEMPEFDVRGIISGVQDGGDTAGLMAGLELGMTTRGRAFRGFQRQSGNKFLEGPQYEDIDVGKVSYSEALRKRTIANIKDSDFTLIIVQGGKKFDQVNKATVRGGGGTGLTLREARRQGKPVVVVDIDAPDAAEQIREFLKGKRGVMNVAGPRALNADKGRDVLVRALRGETPAEPKPLLKSTATTPVRRQMKTEVEQRHPLLTEQGRDDVVIVDRKSGKPIATGYARVVYGDRGAYIEFTTEQIDKRLRPGYRKRGGKTYYDIVVDPDGAIDGKGTNHVYLQKRTVKYADYEVGKMYVSPELVEVRALSRPTSSARSFEIVGKGKGDFDGMRARGKNITNTKPGEPGALGNPFVAKDAGGKWTREQATAEFEKVFLERIDKDPEFKAWVLSLRGKKIGYYKPDEDVIHLQVVQRWLEKQVDEVDEVYDDLQDGGTAYYAMEGWEPKPQGFPFGAKTGSLVDVDSGRDICIATSAGAKKQLEDAGFTDVKVVTINAPSPVRDVGKITHYIAVGTDPEGQRWILDQPQTEFIAYSGKGGWEHATGIMSNDVNGPFRAFDVPLRAYEMPPEYLFMTPEEVVADMKRFPNRFDKEDIDVGRSMAGAVKDVTRWGDGYEGTLDGVRVRYDGDTEELLFMNEDQMRFVADEFRPRLMPIEGKESVQKAYDRALKRGKPEEPEPERASRELTDDELVEQRLSERADAEEDGTWGMGEPDEGPRELSPVETGVLSADELAESAVPRADPELVATNAAMSVASTAARSAEYRFLRAQRELRQMEIELHAAEADLAADLARIRGGTAMPLTNEDVEALRRIVNWLDASIPPQQFVEQIGTELDEKVVDSLAHTLWLLENQPDQALRWATQPSREWQLLLYADLGYNPARLAKFLRGGATRRMESVWSNKFLFRRWSVDDGVTLYKTIVMAKISTMLRITMADEFTRLFAEGMNPFEALGKAKALKAIDKLPEDIQFKLSEMIGKAVEGPMTLFDISHPKAWTAYRHILVNDRRDRTFVRYQWGKQLTAEERARQVDAFLATEKDANFVKMVRDYQAAGDEFRAWYALGYREEQGLRRIGASSHRVIETNDGEMLTRQSGLTEYQPISGPSQDQYADARNLVDHLVQDYDWWTTHDFLGSDWRMSRRFTDAELSAFEKGDLRMPSDMMFGDRLRRDIEPSRKNWERLKEEVRRKSKLGQESEEQLKRLVPGIWGHSDGTFTAGVPVVRTFRDQFYRILDYAGSKLNEMVYAEAFTAEKKLLMAEGLAEDIAEKNAAFYAREYVHRVMFNNATYMGEDMLRNVLLFLPAYRQFVQYWVPYLAKHPAAAALAYRANRDKDQFQDMRVGPMSLDLSRMSFLINQGDNRITGWLPSAGPIITLPVSYLSQDADEASLWGSLGGNWPFEYAKEGMPLHSPLDKIIYGLFGKTMSWPFGSNGDRNPWRELQIIRAAELKGERVSKDEAHWINRLNRLYEGGWNFVVPVGMRFIDSDVESMQEARSAYNQAKTPEEVEALLADPVNKTFKTFIEWQNKPSWDQLQFLKEHPEIIPYMVSGFEGRRTNERDVGFIWSKLADIGVADPAGYIDRIDDKVATINRVIAALDARKARDDEVKWWETYKRKHEDDHNIARLAFEWQNSEGEFAPGGAFYQQGRLGYAARNEDLNGRFTGLTDPFVGITPGEDFDNDSYRLAKLLDEAGGHAKALLQLSPNYDMYVLAKLQEHTTRTTELLETWKERRMATRMTPQDVRRAGYNEKDAAVIMTAVKSIDQLWDAADRATEPLGKYGYATKQGRAIRKQALEYQNGLIESSPLLREFLGDNVTSLYGKSYLTKPAYQREDLIRLDEMDTEEREAFYRLRQRRDENGRPVWDGLYMPEGEKKYIEGGTFLGYVPTEQGWMTKVRVGEVVGLVKGKMPKEGKQILLDFERAKNLARSMQTAGEPTLEKEKQWLASLKKSYPAWAKRLIEDAVRASCWSAWLELARKERHNLRTTINEYYSDAPGYSLNSKYGMKVKKSLLGYAKLLGQFEPTFRQEFSVHNSNNEMVNSILGWYL